VLYQRQIELQILPIGSLPLLSSPSSCVYEGEEVEWKVVVVVIPN